MSIIFNVFPCTSILINITRSLSIVLICILQVGDSPFIGNLASDAVQYQIAVTTGIWRNSSTTARVYIVLHGSLSSSQPILLHNPSCVSFARGNTDVFVLSFHENLGKINKIRIWHDNSGINPSWYLNDVSITDDEQQQTTFIFQQWLAVQKGAGFVDRTKAVSTQEELTSFKASFSRGLSDALTDKHLWVSVFAKTPLCVFTRVQRVTCCLSIVLSMMLVSAMFYDFAPQQSANTEPSLKVGPIRLKMRQLIVAIQCSLIVAPFHFMVGFIFQHIRPIKRSKFDARYSVTRPVILTRKSTKPKCQILLPNCFTYVAYFLCFASVVTSSLFIVFYSLQWGSDVTVQWLISLIMSITMDICITEPVSLVMFVLLLVVVCRSRPNSYQKSTKSFEGSGAVVSMDHIQPYIDTGDVQPTPPTKEQLSKAARLEALNDKLRYWFSDLVVFIIYLWILIVIAYANRDYFMFTSASTISNTLDGGKVSRYLFSLQPF